MLMIRYKHTAAIIFLVAITFPLLIMANAMTINRKTGIRYAVSPKIPNITPLIAFPITPIIPKLHKNRKTHNANKAIKITSLLIATSIGSL